MPGARHGRPRVNQFMRTRPREPESPNPGEVGDRGEGYARPCRPRPLSAPCGRKGTAELAKGVTSERCWTRCIRSDPAADRGHINIIYGIGALDDANVFVNDQRFVFDNLNTLGWVLIILGVIQLTGRLLAVRRRGLRAGDRDHRRQPRRDRSPAVDRRRLPVVVAGRLRPLRLRRPRPRRLRRGRENPGSPRV